MQVGMDDVITLDRKSFEALAADSRVRVLKSLAQRRKTLSELSQEIGLSNSTMKEHLDVLVSAGLAVQMDEGRKWKYYELTRKGKGIFVPAHKEVKVLIMLALSVLLVVGSFWSFAGAFANYSEPAFEETFASGGVPFPMLGGAAAPVENAEEGIMAKAAPPEEGTIMAQEAALPVEGDSAAMEAAGAGQSTEMMAYGAAEMAATEEGAYAPIQEKQFPFVEAILLLGSVAIFALSLYYAKKEQ
jgi:ArsR family transcriptional regulator